MRCKERSGRAAATDPNPTTAWRSNPPAAMSPDGSDLNEEQTPNKRSQRVRGKETDIDREERMAQRLSKANFSRNTKI